MSNTLSLNIYGENDEIIKTYETEHLRWKIFTDAVKLNEKISGKEPFEQLAAVGDFIKSDILPPPTRCVEVGASCSTPLMG